MGVLDQHSFWWTTFCWQRGLADVPALWNNTISIISWVSYVSRFHLFVSFCVAVGQCDIVDPSRQESNECRRPRRQGFLRRFNQISESRSKCELLFSYSCDSALTVLLLNEFMYIMSEPMSNQHCTSNGDQGCVKSCIFSSSKTT